MDMKSASKTKVFSGIPQKCDSATDINGLEKLSEFDGGKFNDDDVVTFVMV